MVGGGLGGFSLNPLVPFIVCSKNIWGVEASRVP